MLTQLGLIGVLNWSISFAYDGKHNLWDPFWIVPGQWAIFLILIGIQIVCVSLLIFPKEWFVGWAEDELGRIKSKDK